ncbi:MAG: nucleotidyltransferase family protein [Lachnospiraceae bacterium]|nr:nucleotidyltransferase family protein [Lachnospiraceae bacterium]
MDIFYKDLGELVLSSLENRKPNLQGEKPDYSKLLNIAYMHHMGQLLLVPALNSWNWSEQDTANLKKQIMGGMFGTAKLDVVQKQLEKEFEENGVKFLMMKGSVIKYIYPKQELREMGDIDLLVYPESFPKAEEVLETLGYVVVEDVKQHKVYKSPGGVCVEAHHTMCDRTTDKKMYEYFCDYSKHKLKDGKKYTYEMTNEDFYVYLMAHMARHFYVKGCGIRNLVDIYIYDKVYGKQLNRAYVEQELNKIGILDYTKQMEKLTAIWLKGQETAEVYDNIFEYMLDGGSYGHDYNGFWNRFSKVDPQKENKFQLKLWYYFPPLTYMSEKYPFLEKAPACLPFFWVKRVFDSLFASKKVRQSKEERREHVQNVDENTIRKMSEIYRSMNFRFTSR